MGKELAIKGHSTRGKEVIELLEMMGGINPFTINDGGVIGNRETSCYYISKDIAAKYISWDYIGPEEIDKYKIFTLEEFLEKYPFKIGDKVTLDNKLCTITWMCWECNNVYYQVQEIGGIFTKKVATSELKPYKETDEMKLKDNKCESTREDVIFDSIIWHLRNSVNNGKQNLSGGECEDYFREVVKKNNENKMKSVLAELLEHIKTTSKEELEREFEEIKEWSNVGPTVEEFRAFCECVNKKPKYPKTYEECCEKLGIEEDLWFVYEDIDGNHINSACISNYRIRGLELYHNLEKLKIRRDAYWKIAGEEMGLGKPWEPDWTNEEQKKYCIYYSDGNIQKGTWCLHNSILAFPSEEMRDTFYDNFKDLIEQCKELI